MKTFPVDDDLVALVWAQAHPAPFENLTFSQALRRVLAELQIDQTRSRSIEQKAGALTATENEGSDSPTSLRVKDSRSDSEWLGRAQKTSIRELVRRGAIREGDSVTFRDFRGTTYPGDKATISGDALMYSDGRRYSMSSLAGKMLKKHGYKGDSVRGPIHWVTSENQTLWDLWEAAVSRNA